VASNTTLRGLWHRYKCAPTRFVKVEFPGDGRTWKLSVAAEAAPAFEALANIMREEQYLFRETAGGTYNCRNIGNTSTPSLHSYGICIDINPRKNPHRKPLTHDYPKTFIARVEALRTKNSKVVFEWGGRWQTPDAMHWELDCGPADVATGIVGQSVPKPPPKPKPPPTTGDITLQVTRTQIKKGSESALGGDVAIAQGLLHAHGYGSTCGKVDGIFGVGTDDATRAFQTKKKLTADGIIGEATWKALED
jgi:D-alanyl-D-alanine carboxypeptidase/Putative peptidoglycan binding domain